jgi:adenylate kinase family enzyme
MSITVLTGPPGAGKTTVARHLSSQSSRGVHLKGDDVFHWIASGYVQPWRSGTRSQNVTVTKAIASSALRFADGEYEVFVDGIIGPWFLPEVLDITTAADVPLHYVVLRPVREVVLQRALARTLPEDLTDPDAVGAIFDVWADLGMFESYVIDTSAHLVDDTISSVRAGLDTNRFRLDRDLLPEMERLAAKWGVHAER